MAKKTDETTPDFHNTAPPGPQDEPAKATDAHLPTIPSPPEAPTQGRFRAKHQLGIVIGGDRHDLQPGDRFDASQTELAGLKRGEDYEIAYDESHEEPKTPERSK